MEAKWVMLPQWGIFFIDVAKPHSLSQIKKKMHVNDRILFAFNKVSWNLKVNVKIQ